VTAARDRRRHARNYWLLAQQRADEGRLDEAHGYLTRAGRLDPSSREIRRAEASLSYARGDLAAAERQLRRLYASSSGRDAATCHLLGNIHLFREDGARALELYREAAASGGESPELCYNRGLACYLLADLDGAEAEFLAALEFDLDYGRAMDGLGCVDKARGRTDSAIAWFQMAADADAALYEAHQHLGEALFERGMLDQARSHLRRAGALDPGRPEAHRLLGEIHAARKEWRQALLRWQRAAEAAPECDEALSGMGRACAALGRPDDAMQYLELALDANPENLWARVDLAALHLRAGRRRRALDHLRRAQRLAGDDPRIAYLIAHALHPGGRDAVWGRRRG